MVVGHMPLVDIEGCQGEDCQGAGCTIVRLDSCELDIQR